MSFVRSLLTEDNAGQIWNPLRVAFAAGAAVTVLVMLGMAGVLVYTMLTRANIPTGIGEYATGFAAILAGFGAFLGGTGLALFADAKSPSS